MTTSTETSTHPAVTMQSVWLLQAPSHDTFTNMLCRLAVSRCGPSWSAMVPSIWGNETKDGGKCQGFSAGMDFAFGGK